MGECMELTLELSLQKYPAEGLLPGLWEDNKNALVAYALTAAYGGYAAKAKEGTWRWPGLVLPSPIRFCN